MSYDVENIFPFNNSEKKTAQVKQLFDEIAGHYDELNHTLSLGIDHNWRKKGVLSLKGLAPKRILDIASGTGDLAIDAYRFLQPDYVLGIDISEQMMQIGREKVAIARLSDRIVFEKQDCADLKLEAGSFDAAIVAFGVRNFEKLDESLQEILRILRPGGQLMILELTTPEYFPMKQGYLFYSKVIIPIIGRIVSKNNAAYNYLFRSIKAFPQGEKLAVILRKNGFRNIKYKKFTFGVCTLYLGSK